MEDVAPKLADELLSAYKKAISKVLNKYEKYIKQGSVSYETAHNFSLEAYDIAFNAVKKTLTPAALPDERLYFNIAERTLKPLIEQGCNDIADYCKQIQKNMNDSLGAHIKAADVPLEADRIDDIVSHAANIEKFDDVIDKIGYSMENLYQHVVDESIRRNADMHYKLGFKPKIIRIAESKCCEWCSNLEGTYNYADVSNQGNDVFRRHRNCRCKVLYEEKKGDKYERTDVWSKKTLSEEQVEKLTKEKNLNYLPKTKNGFTVRNVLKEYVEEATPKRGNITRDNGFSDNKNIREVKIANYLHRTMGGNIRLVERSNDIKMSDYLWNDNLWELKSITTEKAADSAVRKAIKQIMSNPGGIIIECLDDMDKKTLYDVISNRICRTIDIDCIVDVMVIDTHKKIDLLRFTK